VTLIPGGPTLPPIEQQRSHRAVAADDMLLKFIEEVHGVNAGLRSRSATVNSVGSGRQLPSQTTFPNQQTAESQANPSRQDGEDASGETGAAFGFWETDDDDRAKLRHLIEIREQFDLIMIGA
jgi:hypothetical protein